MYLMVGAVRDFKRQYLVHMLAANGGFRGRTARAIGIERTYLCRLIREHGLARRAEPKATAP